MEGVTSLHLFWSNIMTTLEDYDFQTPIHLHPVCVVIICTLASAKVRRKEFCSWDEARMYANRWQSKNSIRTIYNVTIERI